MKQKKHKATGEVLSRVVFVKGKNKNKFPYSRKSPVLIFRHILFYFIFLFHLITRVLMHQEFWKAQSSLLRKLRSKLALVDCSWLPRWRLVPAERCCCHFDSYALKRCCPDGQRNNFGFWRAGKRRRPRNGDFLLTSLSPQSSDYKNISQPASGYGHQVCYIESYRQGCWRGLLTPYVAGSVAAFSAFILVHIYPTEISIETRW